VLSRRFGPAGRDRALVRLATHGLPVEEWKPLLLWHMTRDEFLVRDFLETWLFAAYDSGTFRVHTEDVEKYRGRYDAGWDALRGEVLARQREPGVVAPDADLTARPEQMGWGVPIYVAETDRRAREEFEPAFWYFVRTLLKGIALSPPGYTSAKSAAAIYKNQRLFLAAQKTWDDIENGVFAIVERWTQGA